MYRTFLLTVVVIGVLASSVLAAVPQLINYQGYLRESVPPKNPINGTFDITFTIYDDLTGGNIKWTETQIGVVVEVGIFRALLGSVTTLVDTVFNDTTRYLGIKVGADPEIIPRSRLVTTPYTFRSFHSEMADNADLLDSLNSSDFATAGHTHTTTGNGWVDDGTVVRLETATDSVGIGTATPTAELEVVGNVVISGKTTIGPGHTNSGNNSFAAGQGNVASGNFVIVGGASNEASGNGSTVGGGAFSTASGDYSTIGGGNGNQATQLYGTVSGGAENSSTGSSATIGGGSKNSASGYSSTVGGGRDDTANAVYSGVASGYSNLAGDAVTDTGAFVGGGKHNAALANYSIIGGGSFCTASEDHSTIGGGWSQTASNIYATIAGGRTNVASGIASSIGGGSSNRAVGSRTSVSGGDNNTASGESATVGGGRFNAASGDFATVGGGLSDTASGFVATVGGGRENSASGNFATVGGGYRDTASGSYATVGGGTLNVAAGDYSFAAGRRAKANHGGSFVWADLTNADFASTAFNQFNVRASGGTRIFSDTALTTGVTLSAGGGAWVMVSDSSVKRNIRPVDEFDILEKVASLPISRWSYETQSPDIEHIGPMAQDFYAIFGVGEDEKGISTLDPDGIALAAIKALYQENQELKERLERLEELVGRLTD